MEDLKTLIVAFAFAAVYASAGRLFSVQSRFPRRWLSVAAGVSVAYVFVDILPELEARREALVTALGGDVLFAEQRIYIAALAGFVFFYGLNQFLLRAQSPRTPDRVEGSADKVFWVQISGYALYSWVIGYLLLDRAASGDRSLGLYAIAMALHLAVVGNALVREHGRAYARVGWWILSGSVLLGWLVSVTVELPEITIHRLFAFVAGGVVMTSMNEELPREREGLFWWFTLGAVAYATLLMFAA